MKFSIITLFPEVIKPFLESSMLKRAKEKGLVEFELINLRDFGEGVHKVVDDRPYGGGAGMILKADILAKALMFVSRQSLIVNRKSKINRYATNDKRYTILTSPSGYPFNQKKALKLSKLKHLILICGHYEGVDQRFIDKFVDQEVSIGDYVLTGGELPALVIVDSITRLIPGVLKKQDATTDESFSNLNLQPSNFLLLEYPHYTRPEDFLGNKVPQVLLSGNHQEILKWREKKALEKTKKVRPDLLKITRMD